MTRTRRPLLVAALIIALVTAGCGNARPDGAALPTATTTIAVDEPGQEHDHDDGPAAAASAPPAAAAVDAAVGFVQAWARPDLDHSTWLAAIRPRVLPAYARLLADTDPANVPARTVTGPARPVSSTTAMVIVDVPTDTALIRVTAALYDGHWLVAAARPAPAS